MIPFSYTSGDSFDTPKKKLSVSRKHFKTEHLTMTISPHYKDHVFRTMGDFEHSKKILIVEQYNKKYKNLKDEIAYFDEFKEANPEYFT